MRVISRALLLTAAAVFAITKTVAKHDLPPDKMHQADANRAPIRRRSGPDARSIGPGRHRGRFSGKLRPGAVVGRAVTGHVQPGLLPFLCCS